ncbi:MAG: hypothetical protein Kow0096_10080 [Thiohalomonadaceae bacterium]
MRIWRLTLSVLLLLAGCATSGERAATLRFLHQVPAGTLLSLERTVQFPAGSLRVYFQDGKLYQNAGILGFLGVNRYRAYCALELRQKPAADLELTPRQFRMDKVEWDVTYVGLDTSEFRTQWRLSGGDPAPYAFACYKTGNAAYEAPLSLKEIDRVVGEYFRLQSRAD